MRVFNLRSVLGGRLLIEFILVEIIEIKHILLNFVIFLIFLTHIHYIEDNSFPKIALVGFIGDQTMELNLVLVFRYKFYILQIKAFHFLDMIIG